jgi:hypothetical protein
MRRSSPAPPIDLHIERLVLRGLAPAGRHRIAGALEAELARLLAEDGAPAELAGAGRFLHLDGGTFSVPPGAKAEAIGVSIARQLHSRWKGGGGPEGGGREGGGRGGGA